MRVHNLLVSERRRWKLRLLDLLRENTGKPLSRVFALLSLETGLMIKTIKIYYEELKATGLFEDGFKDTKPRGNEGSSQED